MIGAVCEDFSIWGPMFRVSSNDAGKWESFKSDMYLYAKDNLMRINMYIRYVRSFQALISAKPLLDVISDHQQLSKLFPSPRDPSVAWFVRDEKTSWIGFLSNIGGGSFVLSISKNVIITRLL